VATPGGVLLFQPSIQSTAAFIPNAFAFLRKGEIGAVKSGAEVFKSSFLKSKALSYHLGLSS
jgi:hypothetical protein